MAQIYEKWRNMPDLGSTPAKYTINQERPMLGESRYRLAGGDTKHWYGIPAEERSSGEHRIGALHALERCLSWALLPGMCCTETPSEQKLSGSGSSPTAKYGWMSTGIL